MIKTHKPHLTGLTKFIDKNHGITVLAILILGFAWRLIYFSEILHSPYGNNLALDSLIHHDWAVKLSGGQWRHDEVFFRAPLYPYFLGVIYALSNNSQTAAKLIQMVLGSLSCFLVYCIAKRIFNYKVALIALIVSSFYGMFMYFENELLIVGLIVFLDLLALLLLIRAVRSLNLRDWFVSGLVLGLSAIARPNILIFVVCLPLWIYISLRHKVTLLRICLFTITLAVGSIIPILPVTLHNYFVGKDVVLIASQGGLNFYIGNNPESDGRTAVAPGTRDTWWGGYEDQINQARKVLGDPNAKPSEISDYWYDKGVAFILNDPLAALRLTLKKLYLFWNAHEMGNNRGIPFVTRHSIIFTYFTFKFWLVCPLAFAGAFLALRGNLKVSLPLLFILSYAVSVIMFFVCSRYRMPVLPFLIMFASYAIYEWLRTVFSDHHAEKLWRQPILRTSLVIFLVVGLMIQPFGVGKGNPAQGYFNEGEAYRMKRDYLNAIKSYEKARKADPGHLNAYVNMANVYMLNLNNYKAAEKVLYEGLQIAPTSQDLLYNMGFFYLTMKEKEKAKDYFLRTLQLNSGYPEAHTGLGEIYEMEQDYQKALTEYRKAASPNTRSYVLYGRIGNAFMRLNELPEARQVFERALEVNPKFAGAHINIGETYFKEGNLEDAITHFKRATEIDPDSFMAYNNIGSSFKKMGRWDEALSYFQKAIDLKPDFYIALKNKANLLFSLKKYRKAVDSYQRILDFYPKSTVTWYRLAVAYEKLGMPEKAASSYARLSELDPNFMRAGDNNLDSAFKKAGVAQHE